MNVQQWITEPEIALGQRDVGGLGGFFQPGMRWQHYLDHGALPAEYAEALRAAILERGLRMPGEWTDEEGADAIPLFADGTVATFSWRAWGDLMAAVWSEADNKDYSYMDYYMRGFGHVFTDEPQDKEPRT